MLCPRFSSCLPFGFPLRKKRAYIFIPISLPGIQDVLTNTPRHQNPYHPSEHTLFIRFYAEACWLDAGELRNIDTFWNGQTDIFQFIYFI